MSDDNKGNSHHIVPHENGWAVVRSGSERPSHVLPRKVDAEQIGRQISRNQGTELFIHGRDGKIQRRDSHSKDPYLPKG